jgi:hypothetical protein
MEVDSLREEPTNRFPLNFRILLQAPRSQLA